MGACRLESRVQRMRAKAIFVCWAVLIGACAVAAAQSGQSAAAGQEITTHLVMPPAPVTLPEVFD